MQLLELPSESPSWFAGLSAKASNITETDAVLHQRYIRLCFNYLHYCIVDTVISTKHSDGTLKYTASSVVSIKCNTAYKGL